MAKRARQGGGAEAAAAAAAAAAVPTAVAVDGGGARADSGADAGDRLALPKRRRTGLDASEKDMVLRVLQYFLDERAASSGLVGPHARTAAAVGVSRATIFRVLDEFRRNGRVLESKMGNHTQNRSPLTAPLVAVRIRQLVCESLARGEAVSVRRLAKHLEESVPGLRTSASSLRRRMAGLGLHFRRLHGRVATIAERPEILEQRAAFLRTKIMNRALPAGERRAWVTVCEGTFPARGTALLAPAAHAFAAVAVGVAAAVPPAMTLAQPSAQAGPAAAAPPASAPAPPQPPTPASTAPPGHGGGSGLQAVPQQLAPRPTRFLEAVAHLPDDSWMFVPGAFESSTDTTRRAFLDWFAKRLLPAIPPNSIIQLDLSRSFASAPQSGSSLARASKGELEGLLRSKGVAVAPNLTTFELRALVRPLLSPAVVRLAAEKGHEVVFAPPNHAELNEMATLLAQARQSLGESGDVSYEQLDEALERARCDPSAAALRLAGRHCHGIEEEYWKAILKLDAARDGEPLLAASSEEESGGDEPWDAGADGEPATAGGSDSEGSDDA